MFDSMETALAQLRVSAPPPPERDDFGRLTAWGDGVDPDGAVVSEVVALFRARASLEAREIALTAALADRAQGWVHDDDPWDHGAPAMVLAADELAPALRLSPSTAYARVDRALRIRDRLPGALAAMFRGELDLGRVLAIDEATRELADEQAAQVEARVLPGAPDQTAPELRAALRKAVIAVDPGGAEARRKRAVRGRDVRLRQLPDGMCGLDAVISAVDSGEIYDLINEAAEQIKTAGDTRTIGQRRADALVRMITHHDPRLGPEDPPAPPPTEPPLGPEDVPPDPAADSDPADLPNDTDHSNDVDHPNDAADLHDPDGAERADADEVEHPDEPHDAEEAEQSDGSSTSDDRGDAEGAGWQFGSPCDDPEPCHPDDPGMPEPADLDERFPPETDPVADLVRHLLAARADNPSSRKYVELPWVAINSATAPDGRTVYVGELEGYGPITASWAEHLLATGAARPPDRPSGRQPTPEQAARHDPPAWLDTDVRVRDGTCRAPGCRRAAHTRSRRIDLDHTVPFPRGPTVSTNLGGLCRRHHNGKTARLWAVSQDEHARYNWTSMITGRTYVTTPRGTTGDWIGAITLPTPGTGQAA